MMLRALLLVLVSVAGLGACSDLTKVLGDEASCPGVDCTDDARARYDAIAALDRVTEVERVSRSYGFDRGSSRTAEVRASVGSREAARNLLMDVLAELENWPDHATGPAVARVVSDPPVKTAYVERSSVDLDQPYFEPCGAKACEAALADIETRLRGDYPNLEDVDADVADGTLVVTARATPAEVALAAAGARRVLFDVGLRVAADARIVVRAEGPLMLTLRLEDGLVCEQPPGMHVRCEPDNSEPFGDS